VDIREASVTYERWLTQQLPVLRGDLDLKHRLMTADLFSFFRATFYRWAQLWPDTCPESTAAPALLSVGDLHVENFGTWRDAEGRLIWGINDFDEATVLPYTQDLVRLACSAQLAIQESRLTLSARSASEAIIEGYTESMRTGGGAAVLAERYRWLRELAIARLEDQRPYWEAMRGLKSASGRANPRVRRLLEAAMPARGLDVRFVHRQAGLGSLGRLRLVALANWRGGMVAREAKPLAPSAWTWAHQGRPTRPRYAAIVRNAVRVPDPCLAVHGEWVIRRLAADCSRIRLASLPRGHDESRLLWMMGWETGNIHLGSPQQRRAVLADLARRKAAWLPKSAARMGETVARDWRRWCKIARDD
jgi:Uncharacterized protein conserved in bacteria (DUF2252)